MSGLYDSILYSSTQWTGLKYIRPGRTMGFWKLFCSIWDSKHYYSGFRWTFSGMFKNTFQETKLIPLHVVARGNHKSIINEGFRCYLNKVQKINSADKCSPHQWFPGVFFTLYYWNSGPVDGTFIS